MKPIEIKLDKLWKEAVFKRANYRCELCSARNNLDAHHIYSRGRAVRWELDNGICICRFNPKCTFNHIQATKRKKEFQRLYGTERMAKLHRKIVKDIDYKEIERKLKWALIGKKKD